MLQYVKASKLTTLAAMLALLGLAFLIFGCGDDETPEPTPQPTVAPIDISAITAGVSAGPNGPNGTDHPRRNGEGPTAPL